MKQHGSWFSAPGGGGLWGVVAALAGLTGCAGPWQTALHYTQATPDLSHAGKELPYAAEMTSVVVPPSDDGQPWPNSCPAGGRLFVAYGDFADGNRGTALSYSSDLGCLGSPGCMHDVPRARPDDPRVDKAGEVWLQERPEPGPDGRCHAGPNVPGSVAQSEFPHNWTATDMGLLRAPLLAAGPGGTTVVRGGRVLHFWQAFRAVAPPLPVPDVLRWGNDVPPATCQTAVRHVGVMVRHTDDCGATWSEPRFIDFADMVDRQNQPVYPMEMASRTGQLLVRGKGVHWGTDRFEVYSDPFGPEGDPRRPLYLAGVVVLPDPRRGDPAGERRVDGLLRSLDGGLHWENAFAFPDWGGGPKVMTSTPSGRLFVGRCIGVQGKQRFQLFWFDGMGTVLKGWAFVDYMQDGQPMECRSVGPAEHVGKAVNNLIDENLASLGSSRSTDALLAMYSGVEGGRQVAYVVRVEVKREGRCEQQTPLPEGCLKLTPERKLEGEAMRSVRFPDLIETDRMEYRPKEGDVPPVVLSYLEWPSVRNPGAGAQARYLVRTEDGWSNVGTLSMRGGQPSGWAPRMERGSFIGDYSYGSFFVTGPSGKKPRLHFLWQWPESDPFLPGDNHTLRGNVVELFKK